MNREMEAMITDAMKAGGWIEHDGGCCPVALDSKPGIMFGDGQQIAPGTERAGRHLVGYWTHRFEVREHIIAYRPEGKP